ncbi:hypothetical protein EI94DRAFT_1009299 [Lactarius quietus]|nr:hypothetical protein EI94DRAFT_1009299 [Lactarius quietus]
MSVTQIVQPVTQPVMGWLRRFPLRVRGRLHLRRQPPIRLRREDRRRSVGALAALQASTLTSASANAVDIGISRGYTRGDVFNTPVGSIRSGSRSASGCPSSNVRLGSACKAIKKHSKPFSGGGGRSCCCSACWRCWPSRRLPSIAGDACGPPELCLRVSSSLHPSSGICEKLHAWVDRGRLGGGGLLGLWRERYARWQRNRGGRGR